MGDTRADDRGPAEDGTIRREGSLSRVPAAFAPVVEAARSRITDAFDAAQLQSAYLYGSIPRGTAIPGVCHPDLPLTLHAEPTESDQAGARAVEAALGASFSRRHRGVRRELRPVPPGADRADARRRGHRRHPLDGPCSPHHAHRRPGAVACSRLHRGARREGASPLTGPAAPARRCSRARQVTRATGRGDALAGERIGERRPDGDGSSSSWGAAPRTSAAQSRPHRAGHLPQMNRRGPPSDGGDVRLMRPSEQEREKGTGDDDAPSHMGMRRLSPRPTAGMPAAVRPSRRPSRTAASWSRSP